MSEKKWQDTILHSDATIQDAILNLNKSSLQIVLVVSEKNNLLGTVTDGDIRRGILEGMGINSPITTILTRDPLVVKMGMNRDSVLQLMDLNGLNAIPVVDETRQVVDLCMLNKLLFPSKRPNLMIIMAGGKGIRMRPYTENCPKPLLLVNGKPILEHIIEKAKTNGFYRFVISINYLGYMIEDYFGDGSNWQVQISYLKEEVPLGTAGSLCLLQSTPEHPILVSNGDVITDINYADLLDFHSKHEDVLATMTVRQHEWVHPYGVVYTKGVDITGFEEKPVTRNHINAGVYVLEPNALDLLVLTEHCDMPTLFRRINEKKLRTIVYPIHEPWLDVGREEDYSIANRNS
jgi:dTDP-glucose pyrophosphorylase